MKSVRNKKHFVILVAMVASIAVLLTVGTVSAASWPEKGKTMTMYIVAGAGGGADMAGRAMAQFLEKELGVKIVVINKPGGATVVGYTEFLSKSGTDGYTIICANSPVSHAGYIDPDRKATYSMKDIKLAVNYAFSPCAVAVKKGGKYKSLKDLVEAAKANPGKIKGTASGPLVQNDLAMILLEKATGIKLAHMFFDQQGEQRACLLGDHCDAEFNNDFELVPGQQSGEVETLAIWDRKPVESLPGVPTGESLGYPVYMAAGYGLGFKAGTPQAVLDTVSAAVERASKQKEMQEMFKKMGLGIRVLKSKEFYDFWNYNEGVVREVIAEMKKAGGGKK